MKIPLHPLPYYITVCYLLPFIYLFDSDEIKLTSSKRHEGNEILRGPFEKFVDSPYFSESELFGGAVTVSFF